MSVTTRNPLRMLGGNPNSGFPHTYEVPFTNGGMQNAVMWSGALVPSLAGCPAGAITSGGTTLLVSGAGRLHRIIPHAILTSGQPVYFTDSANLPASGTTISGQKIIGFIPPRSRATLTLGSGQVDTVVNWDNVIEVHMPFTSGLSVFALSGAPGFSISFTPETNPAI